ncbi:MAG TPA: TRAFs-binding domain-containing protein [Candidatus Limnocylindrales bacterium]|jgi:tetratricopeptide (TPR) repeat protein|nr:TRAFs-binding domain-containing protein [Candidatus Limnocylindrales bacterium]
MAEKQVCFVVMGFGKKTDYPTGRVIDLDKSYQYIIKPAAEEAGLECIRADEIIHSGTIDVPMYEQLLNADVVVADVSTSNCNAFYELGVRHALRPYTTITIAEDKMVFPFDVNHIAIRKYQHLGDGIDFGEVMRMKAALKEAIQTIAAKPTDDSPVYTFLKDLRPPVRGAKEAALKFAMAAISDGPSAGQDPANTATVSTLMAQAQAALDKSDFLTAKSLLAVVRSMIPNDPYVAQKLALATYKSKLPDPTQALKDAHAILTELNPEVSTDTETLGLWGAVHKRLWEITADRSYLDISIFSYEKGFYLKNDYYNGINLAYLYNERAAISEAPESVADFVCAERARKRVLTICDSLLQSGRTLPGQDEYWIRATMAEAWLGLGDVNKSKESLDAAFALQPSPSQWMRDSTQEQLQKLEKLLASSPLKKTN